MKNSRMATYASMETCISTRLGVSVVTRFGSHLFALIREFLIHWRCQPLNYENSSVHTFDIFGFHNFWLSIKIQLKINSMKSAASKTTALDVFFDNRNTSKR
jgi:hypothetical protein